jgi:hypothetical protein
MAKAPAYAEHPAVAYQAKVVENLKARTGKSLEEWLQVAKACPQGKPRERLKWFKNNHGLGMTSAMVVLEALTGPEDYKPHDYVEEMFSGKRSALRPLYDTLLETAMKLGKDVTAAPCKTMVPIRRKRVIAQIKPASNTRIDLGLALGDTSAKGILQSTGGLAKGDRITHKITVESPKDITPEVKRWLQEAYRRDA